MISPPAGVSALASTRHRPGLKATLMAEPNSTSRPRRAVIPVNRSVTPTIQPSAPAVQPSGSNLPRKRGRPAKKTPQATTTDPEEPELQTQAVPPSATTTAVGADVHATQGTPARASGNGSQKEKNTRTGRRKPQPRRQENPPSEDFSLAGVRNRFQVAPGLALLSAAAASAHQPTLDPIPEISFPSTQYDQPQLEVDEPNGIESNQDLEFQHGTVESGIGPGAGDDALDSFNFEVSRETSATYRNVAPAVWLAATNHTVRIQIQKLAVGKGIRGHETVLLPASQCKDWKTIRELTLDELKIPRKDSEKVELGVLYADFKGMSPIIISDRKTFLWDEVMNAVGKYVQLSELDGKTDKQIGRTGRQPVCIMITNDVCWSFPAQELYTDNDEVPVERR
jgi:hypothetical protein